MNEETTRTTERDEHKLDQLRDELLVQSSELRALRKTVTHNAEALSGIGRNIQFLVDFLNAVRKELNSSLLARAVRRIVGTPPAAPSRPGAPGWQPHDGGWHEDFVRVYSPTECFDIAGNPRAPSEEDRRNYVNHIKFYRFVAQFSRDREVLDAGCGSGYGSAMLADAGARSVTGIDLSDHALAYAGSHYGQKVKFLKESVTGMRRLSNAAYDLVICTEVLEHLDETGEVDAALLEIKRVARPGAIVVLATPNLELLEGHGFEFTRLHGFCARHFQRFVFFENALAPFAPDACRRWIGRKRRGQTGVVVTQPIDFAETVLPPGISEQEDLSMHIKQGLPPGRLEADGFAVDTSLMHNTHSFVIVAAL